MRVTSPCATAEKLMIASVSAMYATPVFSAE
jgi:hypothetical protein